MKIHYISAIFFAVGQLALAQSFDPQVYSGTTIKPLTPAVREVWVINSTFGLAPVSGTLAGAALNTLTNSPKEYGSGHEGFARRASTSIGTSAIGNTIEASMGSLWSEDPRYRRRGLGAPSGRLGYAVKMAFMADRQSGGVKPAYARLVAISSSQLISLSWRPDSELTAGSTVMRIGLGFAKRAAANGLTEFWPDIRRTIIHR